MTNNKNGRNIRLQGIAVSPGIIIGKARLVDRSKQKIVYQYIVNAKDLDREVERFTNALQATREQISAVKSNMPEQLKQHAFILEAHLMILDDSMISDATVKAIVEEKINAEWALKKSVQKVSKIFNEVADEYIRERFSDVENVAERILRNLAGKGQETITVTDENVIIVAHNLSPADTTELNTSKILGFITDIGGRTSHTAIMAQALEIPAVVGLETATSVITDGCLLIVDGYKGDVIINPDINLISAFQEKQTYYEKYKSSILRLSYLPSETIDGHRVTLKANIEFVEEITAAKDHGAEGIGLYRTEYLYLRSKGIPAEEELFNDYRQVAQIIQPETVTIRTLDIGGDKLLSSYQSAKEMNPALGLRAIRFCLKEQDVFRSQLRAILRASAFGRVQILFPMISGLQELLDVKKVLAEVMRDLKRRKVDYDHDIKIGIMIEIPSAVTVADILAKHVDFFSIGTNDLIQYALAIDRVNEHVAFMYEPYHPAVIRMIMQTVKAARDAGIDVALCGEMAGDPMCASILLGIGIDELSMTSGAIPLIKKIIRSISRKQAMDDLNHILELTTAMEVKTFIEKNLDRFVPDIKDKNILQPSVSN